MSYKNICVFVSGGGTNLQALIDAIADHKISNGIIKLVVSSNSKAYAIRRAQDNQIPTKVISKKSFDDITRYDRALIAALEPYNIDLIVMAGFLSIVGAEFSSHYDNRIINIHPALIPSFCGIGAYGLKVHEMALEYGVKITGATVHFVNRIPDGGPIILQKAVQVLDDDTPESLQKRVMEQAEQIILPQAVNYFCNDMLEINGRKVKIIDNALKTPN